MPGFPSHRVIRWPLRYLLAAILILFFALSCRMDDALSLTPEEHHWLKAHQGDLTILLEDGLPPYVFHDEAGDYDGFFVDYLREIEKQLGLNLPIKAFTRWNELLDHARTNRNFIFLGIHRTDERARYLLFTDPVVKVPYAIVTRKTTQGTAIPEFAEKKLCAVTNYAVNDDLTRYYPHITPIGVKTSIKGLHEVSSGNCDAMVINQMEASYLIENLGLTNLQIAGQTQFRNRLALATSLDDPELFSILEKIVDQIEPNRRQAIYRRWVSTGEVTLPETLRISLQIGTGLVFSLIFLLWAWTTSLRQQVGRQTQQIRENNENLRITLDSIGDAVITTGTDGKVTRLNAAAENLTGWPLEDAEGKDIRDVFRLQDRNTDQPISLPEFTGDELSDKDKTTTEAMLISRNESLYRIGYNFAPIRDETGKAIGIVIIFKDITDKMKAEEDLLRVKKLESLGILAGGIAHDFNNLLTGLYGNISMAKMALPPTHEAMDYLASAEESMEAAVALTGQFLTFSKNEQPVRKVIAAGKTLAEAAAFAAQGLNARLETSIDDDLWPVSADKGQLSQIVGNLVINAHQAMSTGGVISLTACNAQAPSGRTVRITIQDTGTGIDPEHLDKIFDPYFTTKKTGSGLGLATTYAIVAKHNGTIAVDSELGKGTTFTLSLPAATKPIEEPLEERLENYIDTHALEAHVLVLDDQAVIRKILETILRKLGIRVTFTVEGHETVEAYRKRQAEGKPFDCVVLDLTIPGGMGGRETSEKILAMDPQAKIILSSGYASDPIMSNYEEHGIKAIAVKPYRFSDFKEILLRVLLDK
ncbi:transporter substrate-binding domain-containing protein [Desulfoluna sp.]|uniref:ATP-binding protein n=1 Tax=Desulfoluna sp. TaxID=2045199 RepID=UPI00262D6221|nr:transporter substrate-binding domain-containing protein [Desulfoluna sp.]